MCRIYRWTWIYSLFYTNIVPLSWNWRRIQLNLTSAKKRIAIEYRLICYKRKIGIHKIHIQHEWWKSCSSWLLTLLFTLHCYWVHSAESSAGKSVIHSKSIFQYETLLNSQLYLLLIRFCDSIFSMEKSFNTFNAFNLLLLLTPLDFRLYSQCLIVE